jgi:cytochrome P450
MVRNVKQRVNISPGRFFAVNEIKLMLAFILLRFDITTKNGVPPRMMKFMAFLLPDMKGEILFRKRVT